MTADTKFVTYNGDKYVIEWGNNSSLAKIYHVLDGEGNHKQYKISRDKIRLINILKYC